MSEGAIPVNLEDLPIEGTPLDESEVYTGELVKSTVSPKTDKRGNVFVNLQVVVTEGDAEGKTVMLNYLPLPVPMLEEMTKRDKMRAEDISVAFARFCRSFGIRGRMPQVDLSDPESIGVWQDWISQFYGRIGKFTVKNQEFPEGSGRLRSGISDFLF